MPEDLRRIRIRLHPGRLGGRDRYRTPGGLGAVEAALTAGLTAAGVPGAAAASAVLLFRLLTFWLPIPFGWGALKYLERQQAL